MAKGERQRAIVFLDVSAVMVTASEVPEDLELRTGFSAFKQVDVTVYDKKCPVTYAPELVDLLNDLSQLPGVYFHWVTDWEGRLSAYMLSRSIGLKGTGWKLNEPMWGQIGQFFWKYDSVRQRYYGRPPEISYWVDSEIIRDDQATKWVSRTANMNAISPSRETGLTRSDVLAMTQHIQSLLNENERKSTNGF